MAAVGSRLPRLLPLSENKLLTCHALFNMHLFGWRTMQMRRRAEGARQHLLGAGWRMRKRAGGVVGEAAHVGPVVAASAIRQRD